jgi:hypothetical protein
VRDLLSSPPHRGGGLHNWLFRAALALHRCRTEKEIYQLLASAVAGEPLQPLELENAIANSKEMASAQRRINHMVPQPRRPVFDPDLRAFVIAQGDKFDDLIGASPFQLVEGEVYTEQIIDILFPGDPLLCCGNSPSKFETKPKSKWRGKLSSQSFVVPNPMVATHGKTQEGKNSARCLDNTGPRRFLVIEFDKAPSFDEQAAIILYLGSYAPLAMVVYSGNKSCHAWFFIEGTDEKLLEQRFMACAIRLGADPATWTRCQFVRMPDGLRDNGTRQTVYFLNPSVVR